MEKREINISCEDALAAVREMRMMDDAFMQLCFADSPQVVELILRIVLNMPALRVETLKTQEKVAGMGHRTVCFDALCRDGDGAWYDVELQKDSRGASVRRARYYASSLDVHLSETGDKFDQLPDAVVVFITETDTLGYGEAVTAFERRDTHGRSLHDGSSIVYVNGTWCADDAAGRLMSDLMENDSKKMHYKVLADRVQSIKEPMVTNLKEGNMSEGMYKILSKYSDAWEKVGLEKGKLEGRLEGKLEGADIKARSTARAMLARHLDIALIADCTGLPQSEVEAMAASALVK